MFHLANSVQCACQRNITTGGALCGEYFSASCETILNPNFICKYKYFMSVKNERTKKRWQRQQYSPDDEMIIPILLMCLLTFLSCLVKMSVLSLSITITSPKRSRWKSALEARLHQQQPQAAKN